MAAETTRYLRGGIRHALVIGVHKDGRSLVRGYGTTGGEPGTAPDGGTVFQIASLSKLFTAATLQILADEGVLDRDATLEETIGATVELSPRASAVTLRQLAAHTSGFPRIPERLMQEATAAAGKGDLMRDPYAHLGPERVFACLASADDQRAPGRFAYSNFGMGLLGHVLESVTRTDFEALVRERLLRPLGMRRTAITMTPELRAHLAPGHAADGAPAPPWTFAALAGAGAFASTADDMLAFVRANLGEGGPLSSTLATMHEPQFGGDTGIGWLQPTRLHRLLGNRTALWHDGRVGGYSAYLSVDPTHGCGVVVLSSRALDVSMLGAMLMRRARTRPWGSRDAS